MAISSGLALKTVGGLAAATAVGGGTYWLIANSDEVKRNEISKYDRGLIEYLDEGGKIQFAVTSGTTSIDSFPSLTGNPAKLTATIKIKVGDGSANTEGVLTEGTKEKAKKEYLRKLNGGSEWTWICEMTFVKEGEPGDPTALDSTQSDKILKTGNEGLFGKLKKEINGEEDEATKNLKKSFIKKCALARKQDKNKEINKNVTNSEIKTDGEKIKLTLVKGENGNANKLFFKEPEDFKHWFSEI